MRFDVLSRHTHIQQHHLLEASAGTGKTFSIQNIVARLILEGDKPLELLRILIVTFTRTAARDLRRRVRAQLEQLLLCCQDDAEQMPDYLLAFEDKIEAKRRIQWALFAFDQAQICTIHAFCARMLNQFPMEGDSGLQESLSDEILPKGTLKGVVEDFLRTEVDEHSYSSGQLELILKEDPDQSKLLNALSQTNLPCLEVSSLQQQFSQFLCGMRALKDQFKIASDKLFADFEAQAPLYKNAKGLKTKKEASEKIQAFVKLFDQDDWTIDDFDLLVADGLVWIEALHPSLIKKTTPVTLHYPDFYAQLDQQLSLVVEESRSFPKLFARMVRGCQLHWQRFQQEEELLSPDDLLRKMALAIRQESFLKLGQASYDAVIIDEFQDTDPIQWDLFQRLFLSAAYPWNGFIYLVGDPKQSIYSFRQADIYTYLKAAEALGRSHWHTLEVNYRSQPPVVAALNRLFHPDSLPSLFPLPKTAALLDYRPVESAPGAKTEKLLSDRGVLHFLIADAQSQATASLDEIERTVLIPAVVDEIQKVVQSGLSYSCCAVLVKDRFQALRLITLLQKRQIPYVNQRAIPLADSPVFTSLLAILQALLNLHDHKAIRAALGSCLFGWTHSDLLALDSLEKVLPTLHHLRESLRNSSWNTFINELLKTHWKENGPTLREVLISVEGGLVQLRDLYEIAEFVTENCQCADPEEILAFLSTVDEEKQPERLPDPAANGVRIITLHSSKGLEFDVVFALGLISRAGVKGPLIIGEQAGIQCQIPLVEGSPQHLLHCEEADSEKMRQLYVALTRAKRQLYIPAILMPPTQKALDIGSASPLELLMARLDQKACSYQELYCRLQSGAYDKLIPFLDRNEMSYSLHQQTPDISYSVVEQKPHLVLTPPPKVKVGGVPLFLSSYTSIHRRSHQDEKSALQAPHDFKAISKTRHTLPSGSATGVLLHSILENIPFHHFRGGDDANTLAKKHLHSFVRGTEYVEWTEVLAEIISSTLTSRFSVNDVPFQLNQLQPSDCFREMPFLFPREEGSQELIKGVVDLIFRVNHKVYILDWKTNWLGSNFDAYQTPHLEKCMQENGYFLQSSLYAEALQRTLALHNGYAFGGVFYLFLRGFSPKDGTGIYFHQPSAIELTV